MKLNPCRFGFVYRVSNITENTKWAGKYINAKFICISRNFSNLSDLTLTCIDETIENFSTQPFLSNNLHTIIYNNNICSMQVFGKEKLRAEVFNSFIIFCFDFMPLNRLCKFLVQAPELDLFVLRCFVYGAGCIPT